MRRKLPQRKHANHEFLEVNMSGKLKGPLMLLGTAILWGLAFVAQTTASNNVEPFTFNASRNFIGALFLTGVIAVRKRIGHDIAPVRENMRRGTDAENHETSAVSTANTRQLALTPRACLQ